MNPVNINLGDLIAVLGPIDSVLGSVDLLGSSISSFLIPFLIIGLIISAIYYGFFDNSCSSLIFSSIILYFTIIF